MAYLSVVDVVGLMWEPLKRSGSAEGWVYAADLRIGDHRDLRGITM